MRWVVLPYARSQPGIGTLREICPFDMKSNLPLSPVEGAPPPQGLYHNNPGTEPDAKRQGKARVIIGCDDVERRVFGRRPGAVDNSRVIDRCTPDSPARSRYLALPRLPSAGRWTTAFPRPPLAGADVGSYP